MFTSVLPWYFNLLLLGWLAYPLVFRVCNRLYDRGYGLSKAFGLVLTTYLTWLLGTTGLARGARPWLPFSYYSVLVAALIVSVISIAGYIRDPAPLNGFLRRSWRLVLFYELVFLGAFSAELALRAEVPHISYFSSGSTEDSMLRDYAAEKFTDFGVLNGLLTSQYFPPHDTWLAGHPMNYYYFGHLLWACLVKFSRVRPEVGFNLALASAFALACTVAAAIGFNLTRRRRWGIVCAFLVVMAGNLDGFLQLISCLKLALFDFGPVSPGLRGLFSNYDFWRSSRAVENTITEFPAFSFVLGDLHAHVSGLPIFLTGICLLIQIWRSASRYRSLLRWEADCWDELFIAAILAGSMGAANSWDLLTFSALFAAVVWSARLCSSDRNATPSSRAVAGLESLLLTFILAVVAAKILFFSYGRYFTAPFPPLLFHSQLGWVVLDYLPKNWTVESVRTALETAPLYGPLLHVGWTSTPGLDLQIMQSPLAWVKTAERTSIVEYVTHWLLPMMIPMTLVVILCRQSFHQCARCGMNGGPGSSTAAICADSDVDRTSVARALLWVSLAVAFVLFPLWQSWVACLSLVAVCALISVLCSDDHAPCAAPPPQPAAASRAASPRPVPPDVT